MLSFQSSPLIGPSSPLWRGGTKCRGGSPHKAFGEVWFPMWRVPPHCPLLYERRGEPQSGGVIVKSLSQPV